MTQGMLYVGTAGTSTWFSGDGGENWVRPNSKSGLYLEARVWCLASHPDSPDAVLAGTDDGIYRWNEPEQMWSQLTSPMNGTCVWALAIAPDDPDRILAGTRPAKLFGSSDGGKSWDKLDAPALQPFSEVNSGPTRVTQILFDPFDAGKAWATVEINGVHRSRDGGRTWEMLFLTNGNGPPGSTGRLLRSRDAGATWEDAGLPGELNSTPWCVATNPADPMLIFTCTNLGQLYRSEDGGESWVKLRRELGEIRSLLWRPLRSPQQWRDTWVRDGRAW